MKQLKLCMIVTFLAISVAHTQWLETTINVGGYPFALAYNSVNNKIYCTARDSIIVIDGATNQIVRTIAAGIRPLRLAYNPISNKIYSMDEILGYINIIDCADDSVIATIYAGWTVDFVCNSHNNKVYCADGGSDSTVTVIDGVSDSVIARIVVSDHNTKRLLYNPTSNKIYCTKYNSFWGWDSTVTVIDGAADTIITSITVGDGAFALGCNPQNNKVYCGCYCEDYVGVIDGATDSVISTVATGGAIWCPLVHNPTDNKMYCAGLTGNVIVFDCITDSVIATVNIGNDCLGFVYNPINNKVYCASYDTYHDYVTIICGAGDTIVTTISVSALPIAFAWNPIQNRVYVATGSQMVSVIRDSMTGIEENAVYVAQNTANSLALSPNPFTTLTMVTFSTGQSAERIELKVYDISGRIVKDLYDAIPHAQCAMQVSWDGTDHAGHEMPSGVYFVKFASGDYEITKKVLLIR